MDRIILQNLAFFGYHGVMDEEKTLGQRFYLDVSLYSDLKKAGRTDDVSDTIHYGMVYQTIKNVTEMERFNLIEALADRIVRKLLMEYPSLEKVQVTVRKPSAPVPGIFDFMAVEIERTREDL